MSAPATDTQVDLDPVTFAVIRNGLSSAVREMYTIFKRTAMLPILYEFNDFGMSMFDRDVNLVADAPGIPVFIGSLDGAVTDSVAGVGGVEALRPGDIILNNHPYLTAGQPADAALIQPIFFEGEVIGYSALRGHMGDVGAKGPYPADSTDIWQEGVLFPAIKLYKEGELNEELLTIVRANSRLPHETVGSILAGASSVAACTRKVQAVVAKYGLDLYHATTAQILDHGERTARAAIERIPDGTYVVEDQMDDDGVDMRPIQLRVAVTVAGSEVTIDVTGSDGTRTGPMNCPLGYTISTCRFALKRVTTPFLPASAGESRILTVVAPEGCVFNPVPPAPTFLGAYTSLRLSDMIVHALSQAVPDEMPAQNGGDLVAVLAYLRHPQTGRWSFFFDLGGPGHGAIKGHDGMNALIHPIEAGCEVPPLEVLENRMPVLKTRFELVPDSGGPGQYRGGLASRQDWEFLSDGLCVAICDKTHASDVLGVAGGQSPPYRNSITLFPGTERERRMGKVSDIPVSAGDVCALAPAGGGGYGDPLERDPEAVAHDVREEYVSLGQAREAYGVALTEAGDVDVTATAELRAKLRARS
jgi:N-methylhydantoinase B